MEDRDRVERAYARLIGLRSNLREESNRTRSFESQYVEEFHEALGHLAACGFEVDEFKVKPNQLKKSAVVGHFFADAALLLAKLDAVVILFAPAEEGKRLIGFRGARE